MADYSLVVLVGRVKDAPKLDRTGAVAWAAFTVETKRREGGRERAAVVRIVAWKAQAELCAEFLRPGSTVMVVGSLLPDDDCPGCLEVVADRVQFLDRRAGPGVASESEQADRKDGAK